VRCAYAASVPSEFATVIALRRVEHGLSVRDVATLAGVEPADVVSFDMGTPVPHPKTVARLTAVLSLPTSDLLKLRMAAARTAREIE